MHRRNLCIMSLCGRSYSGNHFGSYERLNFTVTAWTEIVTYPEAINAYTDIYRGREQQTLTSCEQFVTATRKITKNTDEHKHLSRTVLRVGYCQRQRATRTTTFNLP